MPLCKTVWWFFKKLNIKLPYDLVISFLGTHPKELETGVQILVPNVPSSTIHNPQKVETSQTPINWWMGKQNVV